MKASKAGAGFHCDMSSVTHLLTRIPLHAMQGNVVRVFLGEQLSDGVCSRNVDYEAFSVLHATEPPLLLGCMQGALRCQTLPSANAVIVPHPCCVFTSSKSRGQIIIRSLGLYWLYMLVMKSQVIQIPREEKSHFLYLLQDFPTGVSVPGSCCSVGLGVFQLHPVTLSLLERWIHTLYIETAQ